MSINLYEHQQDGLAWMIKAEQAHAGGILSDEMGTGKTYQILSLMTSGPGPTLVVVPASLLGMWLRSVVAFRGSLRHSLIRGITSDNLRDLDVVFITYSHLLHQYRRYAKSPDGSSLPTPPQGCVYSVFWERIVLEEGHRVRNGQSKSLEAVIELEGRSRWVISGTPLQNKFEELFAYFAFLRLKPLGTSECMTCNDCIRFGAVERVCRSCACLGNRHRSYFMDHIVGGLNHSNPAAREEALANMSRIRNTYFLRRRLSQIIELPERTKRVIYVHMDERERELYGSLASAMGNQLDKLSYRQVLGRLALLRQMCDHEFLVQFNTSGAARDLPAALLPEAVNSFREGMQPGVYHESSKVRAIMEEISLVPAEDKVVIFSHYRRMLRILRRSLKERGIGYLTIAGDVPVSARAAVVDEFYNDPAKRVLLATFETGGEGLNLTAATVALMVEPWYNPAKEAQAAARIHRIGQLRPVQVVRFILLDSIEVRIAEICDERLRLRDFLDGGEGISGKLTLNELRNLLA